MNAEPTDQQFTGKFCWDEIEGVAVPFIIRSCGEMLAEINMLEKTLFRKHSEVLNKSVFDIACPPETQISRVTVSERRLLNEINAVHCDYFFSRKPYTSDTFLLTKDLVIKLYEALELFHKIATERSIEDPKCGYILIDESNTPVPFVDVHGLGMVVPLFFFECPAVMHMKIELEDHWSLAYLKFFCKLLSVHDVFYNHPTLMVVKLDRLKDVIPEAGQITFITTLPSNAKLSEITKYTRPVKRKLLKAREGESRPDTKRPASNLDNSTASEILILSESDSDCESKEALETITIEIEKDEDTTAPHINEAVEQKQQVRKKPKFRKSSSLLAKTGSSVDETNSKKRTANNQSRSTPNECFRKAVRSKQRQREQEMRVKQNKQVKQKPDNKNCASPQAKTVPSIHDTASNQSRSDPNEAPVEPVCYEQLMDPNATSVTEPKANTLTPCYQDMAVKSIQLPDPSLLGTFQTCVTQTGNIPLEQNSLISNTVLLSSLSNNDLSGTPCFGLLPQGSGIMCNDILQANPPLVLSGANNPVYVISPQSEFANGLASSPGIFLASGQPIKPPSLQKPNETYSIIGTQDQRVMHEQQSAALPSSINVGISNSIVILQQQQGQSVENHQQPNLSSINGTAVQPVGALADQGSSVSKKNGIFIATGRSEVALHTTKGSLSKTAPKKSEESINGESPNSSEQGFITVFDKEPRNQYWVLESAARVFKYRIHKIPEYVSLKRPISYRIQKFRKKDIHNTWAKFLCISSSPFDRGNFLINIFEVKDKLFPKVEKTIFLIAAYNMKLDLYSLNSSQSIVFAKRNKHSKRENPQEEIYAFLDQLSDIYVLMSNFFKMVCRTDV